MTLMLAAGMASASADEQATRVETKPYLNMPATASGHMPPLLSQTGVFADTPKLVPNAGLMPYDLVVRFWSDGAQKQRLVAIPHGQVQFAPQGEWRFPNGTVFVKTFDIAVDAAHPQAARRLETRLLVRDAQGGVYGVDYKWRADGSDADLLTAGLTEDIPVKAADGTVHHQTWVYPSREDCLACHNAAAGGVLGIKTRQLNRDMVYPDGVTDNELRVWNRMHLLQPAIAAKDFATLPKLASADDASRSVEDRARSYLDANCAQCHRPGVTVANFDARYDTPLEQQGLIDGAILINEGIDHARVIAPHDIWRSIMYMRMNTTGDIRMPPLARTTIDEHGVQLMSQWIDSLPGRPVVPPPAISPAGGNFSTPLDVTLNDDDPAAEIRYTLDGSAPGSTDARYDKPIHVTGPTIVRARAFKDGSTRSIPAQQVFVVGH